MFLSVVDCHLLMFGVVYRLVLLWLFDVDCGLLFGVVCVANCCMLIVVYCLLFHVCCALFAVCVPSVGVNCCSSCVVRCLLCVA